MALGLAAICCIVSGYLIVVLACPLRVSSAYDVVLRASLSVGFGIGIFSIIFFLVRVLGLSHPLATDVFVLAVLLVATWLRGARLPSAGVQSVPGESIVLPRWLRRVLAVSFGFAVAAALYSAILRSIVHPQGEGWDAFAIWNLHARFLFRGGEHWRDGFSPLIPWSHSDYPLLLPSAVAHFWTVLGWESTAVPAVIGLAFTFSTVCLLFSALAILRGRAFAMLAGLALASTPFFVELGSSQYADVPLAFFFLAVMVLHHLDGEQGADQPTAKSHGFVVLAGLAAGFALWTKNEGMLFVCALVMAEMAMRGPQRKHRLKILLAAVAPFLLLAAWFKHTVAFPNELFSNGANMPRKIFDPTRYWTILQWFGKGFLRFGEWWLVPGTLLLIFLFFVIRHTCKTENRQPVRTSVLTLSLTLAGYFAIFVITPYDLYWHLRFSLNRLFLQLWPCAIFLFFVATPQKVGRKSQNRTEFEEN